MPDHIPDHFPAGFAYVDGEYCPLSEAKISVLDWGFLRSDATYDVVHVWRRRFFRLDCHLDRFQRSVERLRMELPVDRAGLVDILGKCVRRSGLEDAYVEMTCTRGVSPGYQRDPRAARNRLIAFALPFSWILRPEERHRGLHLAISRTIERIQPQSVDSTIKNYHWLDLVNGLFEAYDRGAENILLRGPGGTVAEGPGFNLFVISDGEVVTPGIGVLEGVTRRTALELCAELGIPAQAGTVSIDAVRHADEVFITSTAGGIIPVTRIDDAPVRDGQPGSLTTQLIDLYWSKHDDPDWTTAVDYGDGANNAEHRMQSAKQQC